MSCLLDSKPAKSEWQKKYILLIMHCIFKKNEMKNISYHKIVFPRLSGERTLI